MVSKLTGKPKSSDKEAKTDRKQQDYDSKVTQFNSPTLEEKSTTSTTTKNSIYSHNSIGVINRDIFTLYVYTIK